MMPDSILANAERCHALHNGEPCNSAIFYDWGLKTVQGISPETMTGEGIRKYSLADNVLICARCTTPYITVSGDLVDISADLSAEDVKAIITRGQTTLPHPATKDP